jgi:hypothetical protein
MCFTWYASNLQRDWDEAVGACSSLYGARLCTAEQYARICQRGVGPSLTGMWLDDRDGDDRAIYVNDAARCNNFDGTASDGDLKGVVCCIEFMSYAVPW